jgi:hypothetical protein
MLYINRRGKMKKICFFLFTFMMVVLLGACGSVGKIEGDTATAKTSAKTSDEKLPKKTSMKNSRHLKRRRKRTYGHITTMLLGPIITKDLKQKLRKLS